MVDIIDYGETVSGAPCLLMEYSEDSLEKEINRKGVLDINEASHCFIELLKALVLQEKHKITHLNLKPSNIFLSGDSLKISDYAQTLVFSPLHKKGVLAHPDYSSPEALSGSESHSDDRWAVSVLFFFMLTGTMPFSGDLPSDIKRAILNDIPDDSLLPETFRPFLNKCFQKDCADRHVAAVEMLKNFSEITLPSFHSFSLFNGERKADRFAEKNINKADSVKTVAKQYEVVEGFVNLRKESVTVSDSNFQEIFALNDTGRPVMYIRNEYNDNDNGTITDHATGLMWQKSGSDNALSYDDAKRYISHLNLERFAGFNDWRIPTIEELLSLLEPEKINSSLYIDSLFDPLQQWCWSSDMRTAHSGWFVFYYLGNVYWDYLDLDNYVRGVRHI
ncbi:putative Mitogen-activated protein kinase kinase kinase [Desulfamplus magnetovallimortis]|uniref:Putative Mitogen-activated protein kinase kinase kinase n=1 Tax=Desulfamplus magnetovallimortis TaxID=1246637 RepID=A0A1W1HH22_9BACT|nr:DUF1566 domain-containing protein [Desulfamplus magnetovallimortis]SLM31797.1 putative Mitogen-activated protein kinase kinase kinase [Desulfamplus magnetovallimortis]